MKKVLIVSSSIYGGGAERVLVDLINGLDEKEYDVTLYTLSRDKIEQSGLMRKVDYRVIYGNVENKGRFSAILTKLRDKLRYETYNKSDAEKFYKKIIKEKYDVEIASIEGYATRIISGSPNKNSVKIAWLHTDLQNNGWSKIAFKSFEEEKQAYEKFDKVVCVSENVKKIFCEKFGEGIKTCVITNPIRQDRIVSLANDSSALPENFKEKRDGILRISYLGRIQKEKGADRLLHAFKRISDDGYKAELLMIGDGKYMSQMKDYISENGLSEKVTLFGFLDNPYCIMKDSDLFVCPSRAEGFGLVLVEAMCLSLPVMSTDCAGPSEILDGGKYGMLVENSEDGIYAGIKKFLDEPELVGRYAALSEKRREDYGYDAAIEKFKNLFLN